MLGASEFREMLATAVDEVKLCQGRGFGCNFHGLLALGTVR